MKEYYTYEGMKGRSLEDSHKEIEQLSHIYQKYDNVVGVSHSKSNANSANVIDEFNLSYKNYVCDDSMLQCRGANLDTNLVEKFEESEQKSKEKSEEKSKIKPRPAKNLSKYQSLFNT
jgi:hypothetical protein